MGKVGIGSAEPNKQLDVIGDSGILVASTTNGGISSTSGISIFFSDNRYDPLNLILIFFRKVKLIINIQMCNHLNKITQILLY